MHVRHEEYGAFAAVAEARLTGNPVAVCGTAGPGVVHLFNGLIDARKERAPVIAIAGDVESYARVFRQGLSPAQYQTTTHFNGQSTVTLDGDRATGLSYTIAHHLYTVDGERMIMIASLRYRNAFAKVDGAWLFAERNLLLDWSETRPSPSQPPAA